MRKKLAIIVAVTLGISLVAGLTLPGMVVADETPPQVSNIPPKVLRGEVTDIYKTESSFVIQSGEQEPVVIATDNNTKYFKLSVPRRIGSLIKNRVALRQLEAQEEGRHEGMPPMGSRFKDRARTTWLKRVRLNEVPAAMPTESQELDANLPVPGKGKGILKQCLGEVKRLRCFGEEASFEDIAVGDRVMVRLSPDNDGSLAELVIIFKPTAYQHASGTIGAVFDDSITITIADDETVTLRYDENTCFILNGVIAVEPGLSARAIYNAENMLAKLVTVNLEAVD